MQAQFCTKCGAQLAPDARFCSTCGAPVRATSRGKRAPATPLAPTPRWRTLVTPMNLVLVGSLILLILGGWLFYQATRPEPITLESIPDVHDEQGIPFPEVPRISVEEAKARFDAGTAIFVDVRGSREYAAGHIPNAVLIPLPDLDERYRELPKDAEIITYCT